MVNSEIGANDGNRSNSERIWQGSRAVMIVPLIAVLVATVAVSSKSSSDLLAALANRIHASCHCPQDLDRYTGIVEDCCCDHETVTSLNGEVLHPLLQELVRTPYTSRLWCDCPFWPDDGMCRLRDCGVCECPENEFPETLKYSLKHSLPSDSLICQKGKPESIVDRTLDNRAFRGWIEEDNPWTTDDETDNDEMTYVNLLLNPERYTGYSGPSARRIWDAIYSENCPRNLFAVSSGEVCQEKKVLYRLISGLHSSISVHIAADYLLAEATKMAADYLELAEYDTGNPAEDASTLLLMRQLLYNPKLQAACPLPFDEAKLWRGKSGPKLTQTLQRQFRNISALMDCVGCEKCRLWGKLQVLGLGTALKILFSVDSPNQPALSVPLQRNEVIALINLLNRLSESVQFIHERGQLLEKLGKARISGKPAYQDNPWHRLSKSIWARWFARFS